MTLPTGLWCNACPQFQLAPSRLVRMLAEGMAQTVYTPPEALGVAIDLMEAIYSSPPPNMPPAPWLVHGIDVRAVRRDLRMSYAATNAARVRAIQTTVVDLTVICHRRALHCVRTQGITSTTISMLHVMADAELNEFLRGNLTGAEFARLEAAVQLLCRAPLSLVEMVEPANLTQLIDLESTRDPGTLVVCDFPVARQLRRQRYRSPLPILCPSGGRNSSPRRMRTR